MMRILLIVSCLIGIALQLNHQSQLPQYVASNFGADGNPNAYMPKAWNFNISVVGYLFNTLLFLGIPMLMTRVKHKWVSFPYKDYWLADERKELSMRIIAKWMFFFGLMTNLFIIAVTHLVYRANLSDPVHLEATLFIALLIAYFGMTGVWLWRLYRRFNRTSNRP